MVFQYPSSGPNNAIEYLASGLPWSKHFGVEAEPSASRVDFPFLTSEIYVKNHGSGSLAVGWTEEGVLSDNKYVLESQDQVTFRIRVKTIYLTSPDVNTTASLTVALTMIPQKTFYTLSSSGMNPETGAPAFITGSNQYGDPFEPVFGYDGI
jgi:hypothetical protein